MSRRNRPQIHDGPSLYEDLTLAGDGLWTAECSCGWQARYLSSSGVARGRWHQHAMVSGRTRRNSQRA